MFLGTVIDHNDDNSGTIRQWTNYLVRVDEAFRGLDSSQREVFIDPGSRTSCYTYYSVGQQYLFVLGGPAGFGAISLIGGGTREKPIPERWQAKKDLKVYWAPMCSLVEAASRAGADIAWLRATRADQAAGRVYGRVVQNYDSYYRPPTNEEDVPLAGAKLTLMKGERKYNATSQADGSYSFEDIPAGSYGLEAEKAGWKFGKVEAVDVAPGGCALRHLNLTTEGVVEGIVRDDTGKPVVDVRVELVRVKDDGRLAKDRSLWSDTNTVGGFRFHPVPAGTFVLGVNIASAPTEREPYLATYYPGVQSLDAAARLKFGPNASLTNLGLRLPPRIPMRQLEVRVFWADGSPAENTARAAADHKGYRAAFEQAKSGNTVILRVPEGLDYEVKANWISPPNSPHRYVESDPVHIAAGRGPATIDIRLRSNRPVN